MVSRVKQVLTQHRADMTLEELQDMIMVIRRAASEDEVDMNCKLQELRETLISDLTDRDQRDARLQHYMYAHNIPLDEYMSNFRRSVDNINSLYKETFGNPREYEQGRALVEQTTAYQRMTSG